MLELVDWTKLLDVCYIIFVCVFVVVGVCSCSISKSCIAFQDYRCRIKYPIVFRMLCSRQCLTISNLSLLIIYIPTIIDSAWSANYITTIFGSV